MNPKPLLVVLILFAVFSVASTALAMTEQERQTLIAQIQAQIAQLTQQLNQMLAEQQGAETWCHSFNIDLDTGDTGSEVVALQTALQKEGFIVSASEIQNQQFGNTTGQAVKDFKVKYSSQITTSGTTKVGQITRGILNQFYGCATSIPIDNNINQQNQSKCDIVTHWSACVNGQKSRICSTRTVTGAIAKTITETQPCLNCTPSWQCKDWSACANGQQTRTCADVNNCQTDFQSSIETRSCVQSAYWRCGPWSSCDIRFQQRRICADLNHPDAAKMNDSQYCVVCGNGTCEPGESSETCPKDCIKTLPVCGNFICERGDVDINKGSQCFKDCNYYCGDGKCDYDYGQYDYYKLTEGLYTTTKETYWSCPQDCGYCGDGICRNGKNKGDCPQDCAKDSVCGNDICEINETPESCLNDCGSKWTSATSKTSWTTCNYECESAGKACVEDGAVDKCSGFTDFQGNIYTGGVNLIKDNKNYTNPSCRGLWPIESYDKTYCCCQDKPKDTTYSWFPDRVQPKVGVLYQWTDKDRAKANCAKPNIWVNNECVPTKDVSVICDAYCNTFPYGSSFYSIFPNLSCADPWNNLSKCCTCAMNNVCKDIYGKTYGNTVTCVKAKGNYKQDPKGANCAEFCLKFGLGVKLDKLKMDQKGAVYRDINNLPGSPQVLFDSCGRNLYYDRCCVCDDGSCNYDSECKTGNFCIDKKCSPHRCAVATEKEDCTDGKICNGQSGKLAECIRCSGEGLSSPSQCCRGLTYLKDKFDRGYCKDVSKGPSCGDGICEGEETQNSCQQDCECTPNCNNEYYIKNCGSDGCGGSCGTCPSGQACSAGFCKCVPVCTGKLCGSDGCGGSCGTCIGGKCNSSGKCVTCLSNADCSSGQECNSTGACVTKQKACKTTSDCPYSYICKNLVCVMVII